MVNGRKITVTLTKERLLLLGSNHIENAEDLFKRMSAKMSGTSAQTSADLRQLYEIFKRHASAIINDEDADFRDSEREFLKSLEAKLQ